jgi:hypothetical protein
MNDEGRPEIDAAPPIVTADAEPRSGADDVNNVRSIAWWFSVKAPRTGIATALVPVAIALCVWTFSLRQGAARFTSADVTTLSGTVLTVETRTDRVTSDTDIRLTISSHPLPLELQSMYYREESLQRLARHLLRQGARVEVGVPTSELRVPRHNRVENYDFQMICTLSADGQTILDLDKFNYFDAKNDEILYIILRVIAIGLLVTASVLALAPLPLVARQRRAAKSTNQDPAEAARRTARVDGLARMGGGAVALGLGVFLARNPGMLGYAVASQKPAGVEVPFFSAAGTLIWLLMPLALMIGGTVMAVRGAWRAIKGGSEKERSAGSASTGAPGR